MNNGYTPTARSTDPQTSHDAAQAQQGATVYDQVLAVIQAAGSKGCTLDDLAAALPWIDKITISPVPAKLKEQGIIYETGTTRAGKSGRQQIVHVAYMPGEQVSIPAIVQRARQHTAKDQTPADMPVDALIFDELVEATRNYMMRYAQDEAEDDGPHITGCSQEQSDDARRVFNAIANCKPEGV